VEEEVIQRGFSGLDRVLNNRVHARFYSLFAAPQIYDRIVDWVPGNLGAISA
jgi:hypothetical protein